MPYKLQIIERIFFSRWEAPPSVQEAAEVVERLRTGVEQLGPGPLGYMCSVSASAKLPDARERRNIEQLLAALKETEWMSVHLIFEGHTLQLVAQRLLVQSALLLARITEPNFLQFHASAEPAQRHLAGFFGRDMSEPFRRARALGLLA